MSDEAGATAFELALLEEVVVLLDPLVQAAESGDALLALLAELGWDAEALGLPPSALRAVAEAVDVVQGLIDSGGEPTLETLVASLQATADTFDAVHDLTTAVPAAPPDWGSIGGALAEFLVCRWLIRRHPLAFRVAALLTLVRPAHEGTPPPAVEAGGQLVRFPASTPGLRLDQVGKLLTDPVGTLKAEYLPTGLTGQARADALADRLLPRVGALLQALGADALYGTATVETGDLGADGAAIAAHALTVRLPLDGVAVGASVALRAPAGGAAGTDIMIAPFGTLTLTEQAGRWQLDLSVSADVGAITIGPGGVSLATTSGGVPAASLDVAATLSKLTAGEEPAILIGSANATRLQIGTFAVQLDAALATSGDWDFGFETRALHASVVVSGGDGDGFLAKLLPAPPGITIPFDLAVGWSRTRGLYLGGGTTIVVKLPLHITLFDIITIEDVDLAISPQAAGVRVDTSASAQLEIGPFAAVVQEVGLRSDLTFPPGGGNLGPVALGLGFKPPTGAGMVLDAGPVVGGGFLSFADDSYAGILQLEVAGWLNLKAIGLIATKLPGGRRGFSLLLIITAEFPPIQLGYGFTLNGVGGLIGAHRTMDPEVLRTQLHTGGLDSLLFPPDPVANALEVIANLRAAFPVAEGRFVFGPMAKVGWGASIITLALGILFELPPPLRLALLGRLRVALPTDAEAEVVLQLDILGLWDQATGDISIDATLHDSRIVEFPISGDFALRANVGAHPTIALSVGGFHPSFSPPPGFPHLERVGISLGDSDNPRIRLDTYLALTTNTVQVGAGADLYAYVDAGIVGTFSVAANLAFDAILHLNPFGLQADLSASVDVQRNGASIASAFLELHLTGPTPWHAWGKATVHFLGDHEFDVELTAGTALPPPPPAAVRVIDSLLADLRAAASWAAAMPSDRHLLASFRTLEEATGVVVAHPLGSLAVHERTVPLEIAIERFGSAPVDGPARLAITRATVGGRDVGHTAITDGFAPGQFFALSDDEALRRPAFEDLQAGRALQLVASTQAAARGGDLHYVTVVVDEEESLARPYRPAAGTQALLARVGAAGRSAMRVPGAAALAGPGAMMSARRWTVARTDTLARAPGALGGASGHTEARQRLEAHLAAHPEAAGAFQVVEAHEAV